MLAVSPKRGALRTVLVVEDDPAIADVLVTMLKLEGYAVVPASSLTQGLAALDASPPSLILLDLNLPEGNGKGLDLCRKVRSENPTLPILILTANVDEETAVRSLTIGATDFVRKPFRRRELLALIKNRLAPNAGRFQVGELVADQDSRQVRFGKETIALTPSEFEILSLLMAKPGDVVTRESILQAIDQDASIEELTLTSYMSRIRSKLTRAGVKHVKIVSSYGLGYRLETKPGGK